MASHPSPHQPARRISERRRLKMLKNIDQFRITNPYKCNTHSALPHHLIDQLRNIQFLSPSSINLLEYHNEQAIDSMPEVVLQRMGQALRFQQGRFIALFGNMRIDAFPQEVRQHDSQSNISKKGQTFGQSLIQTKQQISINIFDPRHPQNQSILIRNIFEQDYNINDSASHQQQPELRQPQHPVIEQSFEHYFIN